MSQALVSYHIEKKYGRWHVFLTFINETNPSDTIMYNMGSHRTERLAKLCGEVYTKQANKYHQEPNGQSESYNCSLN